MTPRTSESEVRMLLPKITIAMMICGIFSAVGIGAASAATDEGDVPAMTVKYDPASLTTDDGARQLYNRLARAAKDLCPQYASSGRLVPSAVQQCRSQAVARAVLKINNPRLVAVYQSSVRNG